MRRGGRTRPKPRRMARGGRTRPKPRRMVRGGVMGRGRSSSCESIHQNNQCQNDNDCHGFQWPDTGGDCYCEFVGGSDWPAGGQCKSGESCIPNGQHCGYQEGWNCCSGYCNQDTTQPGTGGGICQDPRGRRIRLPNQPLRKGGRANTNSRFSGRSQTNPKGKPKK